MFKENHIHREAMSWAWNYLQKLLKKIYLHAFNLEAKKATYIFAEMLNEEHETQTCGKE